MDIKETLATYSTALLNARSKCIEYIISTLKELGNADYVRYKPQHIIRCDSVGHVTPWGRIKSAEITYIKTHYDKNGFADISIASDKLVHGHEIEQLFITTNDLVEIALMLMEEKNPHIEIWKNDKWVRIS
jgi:hypothetical protein